MADQLNNTNNTNSQAQTFIFQMMANVTVTANQGQAVAVTTTLPRATLVAKVARLEKIHRGAAPTAGVQQRRLRSAMRQAAPGNTQRNSAVGATIPSRPSGLRQVHFGAPRLAAAALPTPANATAATPPHPTEAYFRMEGGKLVVKKAFRDHLGYKVIRAAFTLVAARAKILHDLEVRNKVARMRAIQLAQQKQAADVKKAARQAARLGRSLALGYAVTVENRSPLGAFTFVVDGKASANKINLHYLNSLRPHHIRSSAQGGSEFVTLSVIIREWMGTDKNIIARPVMFKICDLGVNGPKLILGKPWIVQN